MAIHNPGNLMPLIMGLIFLLSFSSAGWAQSLCTQPVTPSCIDVGTTFDAEEELKRCRQDVADYEEGMKAFEQCLTAEAKEAATLRSDFVERFQCKARKESNCPPPPAAGSNM